MKISCLQQNLLKGLQTVSRAVPIKGSLPILTNVLISTDEGRLRLCATNLETAIITYVPCSVEEDGAITIPAKLIKDFVGNLTDGPLNIKTTGQILSITSDKTKSKFNGVSADEFPELPTFPKGESYLELDPKVFAETVAYAAFASGSDDSRPVFTGILLKYEKGVLTIASTDGFRLSEKIMKLKSNVQDFTAIIPAKTLLEVSRVFATSPEPIKFVLNDNENLALFQSEDTTIATRIIEGQYPDYKRIIPSEKALKAVFNSIEFLDAVRLTNVFAKESSNIIKIRFDPDGLMKITTLAEETGEHESNINAEIEGEIMEIAFNGKYLLDYLNNIKTENINFSTKGNVSPCLFLSTEITDFLHIIMPLQV